MRNLIVFMGCFFVSPLFAQPANFPLHILQLDGEIYYNNNILSTGDKINSINKISFKTSQDLIIVLDQKKQTFIIFPHDIKQLTGSINCADGGVNCNPEIRPVNLSSKEKGKLDFEHDHRNIVAQRLTLLSESSNFNLIYRFKREGIGSCKLIFPYHPE